MLGAYDERRLRREPLGAVREHDGPLLRHHHGTHVTIEHAAAVEGDLAELVERQKSIAAQRVEPIEWHVHRHHAARGLDQRLTAAGFTEDEPTYVMVSGHGEHERLDQSSQVSSPRCCDQSCRPGTSRRATCSSTRTPRCGTSWQRTDIAS